MPLISKEKKETFRTIPIKLEESVAERFLAYAEFLESSKDHVVSEALKYVMDRDKEFNQSKPEKSAAKATAK